MAAAFDITRMTFNVHKFIHSEKIAAMSNEEVGQWMFLWCYAIMQGKDVSIPDNPRILALAARTVESELSEKVLAEFPLVETKWGQRRRNNVQYSYWQELIEKSDKAKESRSYGKERPLRTSDERLTNVNSSSDVRQTNITEQNITEQNITEQNITEQNNEGVGDVLESLETIADENLGAIKKGTPGYFKRGQYTGSSAKEVFYYISKVWEHFKGEAAHARYPSKFSEPWEILCTQKSADLIVPAFEIWCDEQGSKIRTQFPTSEFLKVAQEYMAKVLPLNELRPELTQKQINEATEQAQRLIERPDVEAAKKKREDEEKQAAEEIADLLGEPNA